MMRLRIAILGLSGDPVHAAHVEVCDEIVIQGLADEVWVMITPQNPLKHEATTSYAHRKRLAQLALEGADYPVDVSDFEAALSVVLEENRTYTLLEALIQVYPEYDFSFVMGSDNWLTLHTWGRWQELTDIARLLVIPRPGSGQHINNCIASTVLPESRWDVVEMPESELSSTNIRKILAEGGWPDGLNESQWIYIGRQKLYGA